MKHSFKPDHYFLYQEIFDLMNRYQKEHPDFSRITVIGKTGEGRDILLMEITDTSVGAYEDKPAYYVEGNIHAGEVTGSMAVLWFMDMIFSNMDDSNIQGILRDYTIYLVPRVSPDGSEYYLTTPYSLRSVNIPYPYADEMPGLQPRDIDGDGVVRVMRAKSPYGIWKKSDADPRLMTLRKPDDVEGDFYHMLTEGEIVDFDGLHLKNAHPRFGYDFNRNYVSAWKPEWEQRGGGEIPLATPETRANSSFLLSHRNVCCCLDMHTWGGMNIYTPGCMSGKKGDEHDQDLSRSLAEMAKEENGYAVLQCYDDFMPQSAPETFGGFDDFCHFTLGVPCITIECWDLEQRSGIKEVYPPKDYISEAERAERELKILKWADENLSSENGFQEWTPFEHPQLGTVEIGGPDTKFFMQNPPLAFLEQEIEKHARFMLREVKTLPKIVFDSVSSEKLAEDLYKITVVIGNHGYLSTYVFNQGKKIPQVTGLTVKLEGVSSFISGKEKTEIGHLEGFSGVKTMDFYIPAKSMEFDTMQKEISWVVRAKAGSEISITVSGSHIGKKTVTHIL